MTIDIELYGGFFQHEQFPSTQLQKYTTKYVYE